MLRLLCIFFLQSYKIREMDMFAHYYLILSYSDKRYKRIVLNYMKIKLIPHVIRQRPFTKRGIVTILGVK